jgi:hypothetical protein
MDDVAELKAADKCLSSVGDHNEKYFKCNMFFTLPT